MPSISCFRRSAAAQAWVPYLSGEKIKKKDIYDTSFDRFIYNHVLVGFPTPRYVPLVVNNYLRMQIRFGDLTLLIGAE